MTSGEVITAYIEAFQWTAWLSLGCLGIYVVCRTIRHISTKPKGE